jgi:hypothetical protein
MRADEEALAELRNKVATLECERHHAEKQQTWEGNAELEKAKVQIKGWRVSPDDAQEMNRLNSSLTHSSARKMFENACDTKINLLANEREDLQERLNCLKHKHKVAIWNALGKFGYANGISPMDRQLPNMTFKTPKIPVLLSEVYTFLAIQTFGRLRPEMF